MIKRRNQLILLSLIILVVVIAVFLFEEQLPGNDEPATASSTQSSSTSPVGMPKINGRRVMNLPPGKDAITKLKVSNKVSDWQEGLEHSLKVQGGDAIKDLKIENIESLIWVQHGIALNVESLKITITNDKKEKTMFRAMVDSQNGKILQTWDAPIFDEVSEEKRIKLHPVEVTD